MINLDSVVPTVSSVNSRRASARPDARQVAAAVGTLLRSVSPANCILLIDFDNSIKLRALLVTVDPPITYLCESTISSPSYTTCPLGRVISVSIFISP